MVDIETFKDELTGKARSVYDNFKKTGEDDVFYLGQIAQGKAGVVTLADIIHRAQVFANPEFRGRIGSCTSFRAFNIPVVKGALDGSIKGLKNNGFTSHIVADKKVGLSDLRESYAIGSRLFFETTVTTDISAYECKLENIAKSIEEDVKASFFSRSKKQSMTIKKPSSKNKLCDLMDEIYQVVDKKNNETFDTDLEKATSNILATWLVSRAMNLSTGDKDNQNEKKLDEAMKLQFYTHLNGCSNNGHCAISKIIKQGVELGIEMIDSMELSSEDIGNKRDRLGIPRPSTTKDEQVQDALFGAQCAAKQKPEAGPESNAERNANDSEKGNDLSFEIDDLFDDDDSEDNSEDNSNNETNSDSEQTDDLKAVHAAPFAAATTQTYDQNLNNSANDSKSWPDWYNQACQSKINKKYEEFVKKKGYDPFSGKKARQETNNNNVGKNFWVNYCDLKDEMLKKIASLIRQKYDELPKSQDSLDKKVAIAAFFAGVTTGVLGKDKSKDFPPYNAGYQIGKAVYDKLPLNESEDDGFACVCAKSQEEANTQVADKIAKNKFKIRYSSFDEYAREVVGAVENWANFFANKNDASIKKYQEAIGEAITKNVQKKELN